MKSLCLILILFVTAIGFANPNANLTAAHQREVNRLTEILNAERFFYYLSTQSDKLHGRGLTEVSEELDAIRDIKKIMQKFDASDLKDAHKYDSLIASYLKSTGVAFKPSEVKSNHNFFKNKLNDAFVLTVDKTERKKEEVMPEDPDRGLKPKFEGNAKVSNTNSGEQLTLDHLKYVSDRTTQAAFMWAQGKEIGLHFMSNESFRREAKDMGMNIIGEIQPFARNYNKIYVVEHEGQISVQISGISGADRLEHMRLTADLISHESDKLPILKINGTPEKAIQEQTEILEKQLKTLEKADVVIIGQKGAWERAFETAAKLEAIAAFIKAGGKIQGIDEKAKTDLIAVLDQAKAEKSFLVGFDKSSAIEKGFAAIENRLEKLGITVKNPKALDVGNQGHDFSDFYLSDAKGKKQKWRIFSNVWGDEMRIISDALKNTGHDKIVYIGTAGAFPDSGLKVGDLVVAKKILDHQGKGINLPETKYPFIKQNADNKNRKGTPVANDQVTVANVPTPLVEDNAWLKRTQKQADVVEIETRYLAESFKGTKAEVTVLLLVSDVVGTHETLDSADSSKRKDAQLEAIKTIVDHHGIKVAAHVEKATVVVPGKNSTKSSREAISNFQAIKKAKSLGKVSPQEIAKFVEAEPSFTTEFAQKKLQAIGFFVEEVMRQAGEEGLNVRLSLEKSFVEGLWNPKSEKMAIFFSVTSGKAVAELDKIVEKALTQFPDVRGQVDVKTSRGPPKNAIELKKYAKQKELTLQGGQSAIEHRDSILLAVYKDSMARFGGFIATESRNGGLKLTPSESTEKTLCQSAAKCALFFFTPDEDTTRLMEKFNAGKKPEQVLRAEIDRINEWAKKNESIFEVELNIVSKNTGGQDAELTPDLSNSKKPKVVLNITRAGLENAMVVLEEMIHLQQITDIETTWSKRGGRNLETFLHPYHWFEAVLNAHAGSEVAKARLARAEVEAIVAAQAAEKEYRKMFPAGADSKAVDQYFEARLAHAEEILLEANRTAKKDMAKKEAAFEKSKKAWDSLDKADKQFNDMVAANDRKGVRKLLEKYLPWDLMEPLEVRMWEYSLEAIENPKREKVLVWRGMYDDPVVKTPAKNEVGLMSTLIWKNQGTFNRRLRSLSTMRDKFGKDYLRENSTPRNFEIKGQNPYSISVTMWNHATEAKGSPYISVTPDLDVAMKFGPRQLAAILIDPRRILMNALPVPIYTYQQEGLIPLIVFPDEIARFHDYAKVGEGFAMNDRKGRKADFIKKTEESLGKKLSNEAIHSERNNNKFLVEAWNEWNTILNNGKRQSSYGTVITSGIIRSEKPKPRGGANSCRRIHL